MKKLLSLTLIVITLITVVSLCTACYSPFSGGLLFDEAREGYAVTGVSGWERFYKNFTVNIPSSYMGQPVTEIGTGAFLGYSSLVSVKIPDSIKIINAGAFEGCVLLPTVDIPDSVTYIGEAAFGGCLLLQEINLPDSVTYIGANTFRACLALKNVSIPDSVTYIGEDAFTESDAIVYNEYKGGYYLGNENNPYLVLVKFKDANTTDFTIHSGTKVLPHKLFENYPSLTSLTFEGSVPAQYDEWGNRTYPYKDLPNLTTITVKSGSIPEGVFVNCKKLTNVIFAEGVESIGEGAFRGCESLSAVTIASSVTSIGNEAFTDCEIENVYYGGDVEDWCNIQFGLGFSNPLCPRGANLYLEGDLLTDLTIPDTVTHIPDYAFSNCLSLKTVVIPDSVTDIGDGVFDHCRFLESVKLPGNLRTIGNSAFYDCRVLGSIEIPDTVTSIGQSAFSGCSSLRNVTLGNAVTSIGARAFGSCSALESINIPDTVVSVGKYAFSYTIQLPKNEYDNALYIGNAKNPYLILVEAKDTEIKTCNIHSDTKVISGGAFEGCKQINSIVIPNGIVSIGDYAFAECDLLDSIELPKTLVRIGGYAFNGCKKLTIYCEASQKPDGDGWDSHWNPDDRPVVWGYKGE